jgi:hypothetical protein
MLPLFLQGSPKLTSQTCLKLKYVILNFNQSGTTFASDPQPAKTKDSPIQPEKIARIPFENFVSHVSRKTMYYQLAV